MKNIAVACHTLRDEIELVANNLQIDFPIIWIDSGLHNYPDKLKETLQNQIDRIDNVDNVLLLFGACGNSLLGLKSAKAFLIFPKVDDCISLFLGGNKQKQLIDSEAPSYYLTKGYLESESTIWTEYCQCINKYGHNKTKVIFDKIFNKYKRLILIETGAYNPKDILETTTKISNELGLVQETVQGTLRIVYKALKGEWDEEFVVVKPGNTISLLDLLAK